MSDESHFLLIYWEVLVIWKAAWQAEWVITLKDFINCKQERALSSPCPCPGTVQNSNKSGFPLILEVSNNLDLASDFPRAQISVALFWVFPGLRLISPLWRSFPGQETSNRHTSKDLIRPQPGVGIQPFFCKLLFRWVFFYYKLSFQIFCCSRLKKAVKKWSFLEIFPK